MIDWSVDDGAQHHFPKKERRTTHTQKKLILIASKHFSLFFLASFLYQIFHDNIFSLVVGKPLVIFGGDVVGVARREEEEKEEE